MQVISIWCYFLPSFLQSVKYFFYFYTVWLYFKNRNIRDRVCAILMFLISAKTVSLNIHFMFQVIRIFFTFLVISK